MSNKLIVDVLTKNTQRLDALEAKLGKVGKSSMNVASAAKLAAGAFAALGAGKLVKSFIDVGRSVENLSLRFKFLFGSAQEGAKAFETLTAFAGTVPFSLDQIAAASGNLAVVSVDAQELGKNLEIAGNLAAVSGLDFQTAGEQLQRALSGGIGAADLLREKGVNALLGFKAGAKVTVEETAAAFQRVFGPGGEFGSAATELAKTFDGTVSMLQDKLFNFQRIVGKEFIEALTDQFGELDKALADNAAEIDEIAKTLGSGLATAVITTGRAVKVLADNFVLVKTALVALAIGKTTVAIFNLTKALQGATIAQKAFNLVVGKNPYVRLASILLAAGGALAFYFNKTSDATKAQEEFNKTQKETLRLSEEMSEGSIGDNVSESNKAEAKRIMDKEAAIQALLTKEKSFLDAMGILGEDALAKNLRIEQERISKLEAIRSVDVDNYQKYTDLTNKVEEEATNERIKIYAEEEKKRNAIRRRGIDLFKQGKFKEADITGVTEEEKKEIAISTSRDTLDLLASQNKKFFQIQKAIKIAEAIQNTAQGVTKAFAMGGPLGFITGAAIFAAGMAQVNAIKAQTYPGRKFGGQVMAGRTYTVGENGPETFRPSSTGMIEPNSQSGGQTEVNVNFNVTATDAEKRHHCWCN